MSHETIEKNVGLMMILILLVIYLPHGVVGTWLGWRARKAAAARNPNRQG